MRSSNASKKINSIGRSGKNVFEILKEYMEIFIHLVGTKLRLAHPPVSRQGKNQSQPEVPPQVPSTE